MNGNNICEPLNGTVVDLFDGWAAKTPDRVAAEWQGETLTYGELRDASLHVSEALLAAGVQPRAKVPVLTMMSLEMLPAVIGILRVGACYAPMDVAVWSSSRVEAALSELASSVALVTTECPGLKLPVLTVNFQREWLHSPLIDTTDLSRRLDIIRSGFDVNDLAWIIFTSGTTGKPKGVMIYHRAIYAIAVLDHSEDLEATAARGIRCLLAFSIAFDGCAGVVWTTLTKGGTLAMAAPTQFPEIAASCDLLHLTPSMLAILDPKGPYDSVRYIFLGAEAPKLDVVRLWINPNRKVFNTYGPSETTCIISYGELKPDEEIPFGDLIPGVKIALVDESLQECDLGEVMITGPGVAAGYLNNTEMTAQKFIQWNGDRYYRTGDLARRTKDGQYVWAGRADSLIKNRGFLINLETEVEPAMLSFESVRQAVAVKWRDRLVGCVQPAGVDVEELRNFMKEHFDPFIVPDEILAMDSFPFNVNGKTDRRALEAQLEDRVCREDESFSSTGYHSSAYDALRMAFSVCLHVAFRELDRSSSFTKLGGTSLAAIRLSNALKEHGHFTSVIQVLKLDTIGQLEDSLESLSTSDVAVSTTMNGNHDTDQVPIPDIAKVMLQRSMKSPLLVGIIGTTRYIGDLASPPTPHELHDACLKATSAHSIFQTRFDLDNFTLTNIGHRDLNWREVITTESNFENACKSAEQQAWLELHDMTRTDIEIPFFRIICVSEPSTKSLAFITCVHHALTDVFSSTIFLRDIELALSGDQIAPGPRFEDYAQFMHKYKRANLDRAISFFKTMTAPLPSTSLLALPKPKTLIPSDAFGLTRLVSPTNTTKSSLDTSARSKGITSSTIIYAAWSLFLAKITTWPRVGFSISLSGRTIPWVSAQEVVGPLTTRAPMTPAIPVSMSVHEWLAGMHKTTLDILEFDGLMHSMPESIMSDPRTRNTCVLCYLDMGQTSQRWKYTDRQEHHFQLLWYVFEEEGGKVRTEFDVALREVDLEWAESVREWPGRMLDGLVNATEETLVGDLLG